MEAAHRIYEEEGNKAVYNRISPKGLKLFRYAELFP